MKPLWIIVLMIVSVAASVIFYLSRQQRGVHAVLATEEAPLSSLSRRDGHLCRTNDTQPFTGFALEHHPNGTLKSRSMILNGLLHGLSEGWFTNGQKQIAEHFTNGVSHGLRTKWYASGKKLSEASIVNGHFEGAFRKWHENGVLAEQIQFHNGEPEGTSLAWFQSGSLKARARLEAGRVLEQRFWKDGDSTDVASKPE